MILMKTLFIRFIIMDIIVVFIYMVKFLHLNKKYLSNQMRTLSDFAMHNVYQIKSAYFELPVAFHLKNRKEFFNILDLVIVGRVSIVIITYKDCLSRVGFELFEYLFKRFNTKIIVISEINNL
jgi:putative resolvase